MNRISIQEPCHENWAAMSPTEKGAFCGKCQIDVIDFSGKNPEEVKLILHENIGKHLCGRFKKTQLDALNASYVEWDNQTATIFQSKFLYACLIVFGMTLFSCNTPEEMVLGEISVENYVPDTTQHTTENNHQTQTEKVYPNDDWKHVKGKVDYNAYQNQQENEQEFIKGDVAYVSNEANSDTPETQLLIQDTLTTGTCRVGTNSDAETIQTLNTGSETMFTNPLFSARIFPNPSGLVTTLEIDIVEDGFFTIELVTIHGESIAMLFSGELSAGKSNHTLDLSVYSTGTYFVKVTSSNQTEIFKVLKVE